MTLVHKRRNLYEEKVFKLKRIYDTFDSTFWMDNANFLDYLHTLQSPTVCKFPIFEIFLILSYFVLIYHFSAPKWCGQNFLGMRICAA